jgi:DNA replication protein DnaC
VVLVGQSGVGKSHLMQAVGLSACALGYRVFYTTSARMLIQLTAALADKSLNETLKQYAKWDLLIMDELGFDRIEREECPQAAHLLYKVIDARHQKGSTIVITNVDFDAWGAYLGDAPLAMAMLDRLVDGAVVLKIKGPSYRASRAGKPAD